MNICNADIQEAADLIRIGGDTERYRRLVRGGAAPDVDNQPGIRDLNVPGRALLSPLLIMRPPKIFSLKSADRSMSATAMKCVT